MKFHKTRSILFIIIGTILLTATLSHAQNPEALKPFIDTMEQAKEGMTLWAMIQAGGFIMYILMVLSILTVSLVAYNFMMIRENKLCPQVFIEKTIQLLETGNLRGLRKSSEAADNLIARIVMAGMDKMKNGSVATNEAMENCAKKETGTLWRNITYLADIAAIAPLIGLLGTVLGMIQAFNVIAFQTAVVKPILLAGGVSKAMVTTAGGLIVAIPTLMIYSYLRGCLQEITDKIETATTEIIKLLSDHTN